MSGQFTTETGCTIKVIPPLVLFDEVRTTLVLTMAQPGDLRQVLVLLTDDERAKLKEIL